MCSCAIPYQSRIASQCQSSSFQIINVENRRECQSMGYDVNESLEATNVGVVSDFGELPPLFSAATGRKSRKLSTRMNPNNRRHHDIEFVVLSYNLRGERGNVSHTSSPIPLYHNSLPCHTYSLYVEHSLLCVTRIDTDVPFILPCIIVAK